VSAPACLNLAPSPVHGVTFDLVIVSVASLVLVVALWWAYFLQPAGEGLERRRNLSLYWGYGHFLLFAALAAVGAGLDAAVPRDVSDPRVVGLTGVLRYA
jgi:low temperature requirement protein LtrA